MYTPSLLEPVFSEWAIPLNGARLLVAFSGGLDSTVLARSLSLLTGKHGFSLTLGHVNHRLRSDSGEDEAFCRAFAAGLGLPYLTASLDAHQLDSTSLEAWARRERYNALEVMRRDAGADWILTAHHADDQAETVLMRLMQRSPLLTLAGIRPRRGRLLRPLLSFTREALHAWASAQGLEWREDSSNQDQRFLRNRLRHRVLKDVMSADGTARATLLGLAQLAQRYEGSCVIEAEKIVAQAVPGRVPGTVELPTAALMAVEDDPFKLALKKVTEHYLGRSIRLSTPFWQNLRQFVRVGTIGKVFELPAGVRVLQDRSGIIVYAAEQARPPGPRPIKPGSTRWGYHSISARPLTVHGRDNPLWLRSWRHGDRAPVMPGHGRKLVSDMFIDARLNRLEKVHWPLVVSTKDKIIWVPGLGVPRHEMSLPTWTIAWQRQNRKN